MTRAAHSLKGLCANFGAAPAAEAARTVEQIGRQGDLSGAAPAIESLEVELNRLNGELRVWLTENW